MLSILLEELVDDKKQQFVAVSRHPLASPSIRYLSSYSPSCKTLSVTLVTMASSYHRPPSFVFCPLSGKCSISINTHRACWQRCGRKMWAYTAGHSSLRSFIRSFMVNRVEYIFPLVKQGLI